MTLLSTRPALAALAAYALAASQPALAQTHDADPAHKADDHHAAPAAGHDEKNHKSEADHKDDAHKSGNHKDEHAQHPQGH